MPEVGSPSPGSPIETASRVRRSFSHALRGGTAVFASAAVMVLSGPSPAGAGNAAAAPGATPPTPVERCRLGDPDLAELSGMASDGTRWFAVGDGGESVRVDVLDPATCSVRGARTSEVNPYDVEDLALAPDGAIWLADTGDNQRTRPTTALHVLPARGGSQLYRLSYPDGPHDAEALLLDKAGIPYVVTKEPLGMAYIYRPSGPLAADRVVPWQRVGAVMLPTTATPGGPVGEIGSRLVTGGSVSRDGTLVALRTYTDAYLFDAPDGDVVAALQRTPVAVPLPNEPQGEAIAWEPDGTLLSASEGPQQPVRAVPGAQDLVRPRAAPDSTEADEDGSAAPDREHGAGQADSAGKGLSAAPAVVVAGGAAALLLFFLVRLRRR